MDSLCRQTPERYSCSSNRLLRLQFKARNWGRIPSNCLLNEQASCWHCSVPQHYRNRSSRKLTPNFRFYSFKTLSYSGLTEFLEILCGRKKSTRIENNWLYFCDLRLLSEFSIWNYRWYQIGHYWNGNLCCVSIGKKGMNPSGTGQHFRFKN